ncbi:MAG: hypothetical protein GX625_11095 [Clostridiaceae bacterium]|nr:hypothetical protein [Clostridiaceae bacterium]
MVDTVNILPVAVKATVDTLIVTGAGELNSTSLLKDFLPALSAIAGSLIGFVGALLGARSALKSTEKQIKNSLSLAEKQTYVDLILKNKDKWKYELMDLSAEVVGLITDLIFEEDKEKKRTLRAKSSEKVSRMLSRLSKNREKHLNHVQLRGKLLSLKAFVNFDKDNHPFESNEDVLSFLEDVETDTFDVCKEVWDEIQEKSNWKGV